MDDANRERSVLAAKALLARQLGDRFANWLLPVRANGPEAHRVAETVLEVIATATPERIAIGGVFLLEPLLHFSHELGTTELNALRSASAGAQAPSVEATGDDVVDALSLLAVECIGEMLVRPGNFARQLISLQSSPTYRAFLDAMWADPSLPFSENTDSPDGIVVVTTGGGGAGLSNDHIAERLLFSIYDILLARGSEVTAASVVALIGPTVSMVREAFDGKIVTVPAFVGLVGGLLSDGEPALVGDVIIRAGSDYAYEILGNQALSFASSDQLTTDLIVELGVPFGMKVVDDFSSRLETLTTDVLNDRVLALRFADTLAWPRLEEPPPLVDVWVMVADPLELTFALSMTNRPRYVPVRTPLSTDRVDAWNAWTDRVPLDAARRLRVPIRRLLQSIGERDDEVDALVDAVVSWEALLAGGPEVTLRMSVAIARLLAASYEQRDAVRREVRNLYGIRSKVVHGDLGISGTELDIASNRARRIAIEIMRALLTDRRDLLDLKPSERSVRLLLE